MTQADAEDPALGREPWDPVVTAVNERRFDVALAAALGWWRERPLPALGDAIVRLGARVPDDPLTRALRMAPRTTLRRLHDNLEAILERWGDDPRTVDVLLEAITTPVGDLDTEGGRAMCTLTARHLAATHDARVRAWLAGLEDTLHRRRGTRKGQLSPDEIALVRETLGDIAPPPAVEPSPAEQARLDALAAALEALDRAAGDDRAQGDGLLAEVAANFADDGPKHVYADWLLERGDPLGEFIQLSLRAELDAAGKKRLKALQAVANERYGDIPGRTLDRGFPVRSFSADKYGARKGTYGTGAVWSTIEATDLVPTDDACHTERLVELHVGSTFAPDLARLTRPLGVRTLVMTSFAASAVAAWKKVRVLPEVTTVRMPHGADPEAIVKLLRDAPVGRGVRVVQLSGWAFGAVRSLFVGAVERVEVAQAVVFQRDGDRVHAVAVADTPAVMNALVVGVRGRAEPVADTAVVRTSLDPVPLADLRPLATTVTVERIASGVAARARVAREADRLHLTVVDGDVMDVPALREILAAAPPGGLPVAVTGAVNLAALGAAWAVAEAAGARALHLLPGPAGRYPGVIHPAVPWQRGPCGVRVDRDGLVVELGSDWGSDLAIAALTSAPWPRASVVVAAGSPAIAVDRIRAAARPETALTVGRASQASQCAVKWVKTRKRLEIWPQAGAGPVAPETVDVLLADHPEAPRAEHVQVLGPFVPLADWVRWVADRRRGIELHASPPATTPGVVLGWSGTGVVATVPSWSLRHVQLQDLPDGAFERLVLKANGPVPAGFADTAARVAAAWEVG